METEPRLEVSSDRLVKPGIEPATPGLQGKCRALTRVLKTGFQDSHLAKSRSPTGKSGSPTNLCIPYIFSILAGSDTFE